MASKSSLELPTLNEIVDDLRKAMDELKIMSNGVIKRIIGEESKTRKPIEKVEVWLLKVHNTEVEVDLLIDDFYQRSCSAEICDLQTCITCEETCMKADEKMNVVKELLDEGTFTDVTVAQAHISVQVPPMLSEVPGRKSNLQQALKYLKEEKLDEGTFTDVTVAQAHMSVPVHSILRSKLQMVDNVGERILGVFGPYGVGKTTLLLQIKNELAKDPEIDNVIMITASEDYTEREFQKDIAEKLNLNPKYHDTFHRIHSALKNKNIVILLDDVSWAFYTKKTLCLVDIGALWGPPAGLYKTYPMGKANQHKPMVIISSQREEVCKEMGAKRTIEVLPLKPEEAWHLFCHQVGEKTINSDPKIEQTARKIVEYCRGLPLALITTARRMSNMTNPQEWDYALRLVKGSLFLGVLGIWNEYVEDRESLPLWECFSCCALWPRDCPIERDMLINCWMGHGLIPEFDADNAYEKAELIIQSLFGVLGYNWAEYGKKIFKLKSIMQDFTLWIHQQELLVLEDAEKEEVLLEGTWQAARKISLVRNNMKTLLARIPYCPNLRTMKVSGNPNLPHALTSFHLFPALKYLDLSSTNIDNTVRIIEIGGICELYHLEYLNLSNTFVGHLPDEMKKLVNLKFLVLRGSMISSVAPGLLSGLVKLQVLDIYDDNPWVLQRSNLDQFACSGKYFKRVATNISSLEELKRLEETEISSLCVYCLEGEFSLRLSAHTLNRRHTWLQELTILRCESLQELVVDNNSPLYYLKSLTLLYLNSLAEVIIERNLRNLRVLTIMGCDSLEDANWVKYLLSLEVLNILHCERMKTVICSTVLHTDFSKFDRLKKISLATLPSLISIFDFGITFPRLQRVYLRNCPKLISLPRFPVGTEVYKEHQAAEINVTIGAKRESGAETNMDVFEKMILEDHWNRAKEYSRITYLNNYDSDR